MENKKKKKNSLDNTIRTSFENKQYREYNQDFKFAINNFVIGDSFLSNLYLELSFFTKNTK